MIELFLGLTSGGLGLTLIAYLKLRRRVLDDRVLYRAIVGRALPQREAPAGPLQLLSELTPTQMGRVLQKYKENLR